LDSDIDALKRQLWLKEQEAEYYKRLAKQASDARLRETEELSRIMFELREKIRTIENQRKEVERLNHEIEKLSITDELTRLLNRRGFMTQAEKEFQNSKRKSFDREDKKDGNTFTFAMLDLDWFKKINDTYGHLAGDKILMEVGSIILENGMLRAIDIPGRYGGEEFAIIFPACSANSSLVPLDRLKRTINDRVIAIDCNTEVSITVSIGVSEFQKEDQEIDDIIRRADHALYYAKEHGRDRTMLFDDIKRLSYQ